MQKTILGAVGLCLLGLPALAQQTPQTASAAFTNKDGKEIGQANLTQTPHGVLIRLGLTQLPTGPHAVHVHETGTCDPATGFESAGGHYAPRGHEHGYLVEGGFHAGDLPMQWASEEGLLRADILAEHVTLGDGEGTLFDDDGSALVIHAGPDDYQSQPAGNAGDRIACAVIRR
jgi:Cu-Zn family superoxide dismutase